MRLKYAMWWLRLAPLVVIPFAAIGTAHAGLGCWDVDASCVVVSCDSDSGCTARARCVQFGDAVNSAGYCIAPDCDLCVPDAYCPEYPAIDGAPVLSGPDSREVVPIGGSCDYFLDCGVTLSFGYEVPGGSWTDAGHCFLSADDHVTPTAWTYGDCDVDGRPNGAPSEDSVCLNVVETGSTGFALAQGLSARACTSDTTYVSDTTCVADHPEAFAIACLTAEDCPPNRGCVGAMCEDYLPRCVRFPGDLGACTYRHPDVCTECASVDLSCEDESNFDPCFRGGSPGYEAWAAGDCDGDVSSGGEPNKRDEAVCTPYQALDSGTPDAGTPDTDTPDSGSVTFTGTGGITSCTASRGNARGPSQGLGLTVLSLLALGVLRRRRSLVP